MSKDIKRDLIVGLDIGTSKIVAIVAFAGVAVKLAVGSVGSTT